MRLSREADPMLTSSTRRCARALTKRTLPFTNSLSLYLTLAFHNFHHRGTVSSTPKLPSISNRNAGFQGRRVCLDHYASLMGSKLQDFKFPFVTLSSPGPFPLLATRSDHNPKTLFKFSAHSRSQDPNDVDVCMYEVISLAIRT